MKREQVKIRKCNLIRLSLINNFTLTKVIQHIQLIEKQWDNVSVELKSFVKLCLRTNPEERESAKNL